MSAFVDLTGQKFGRLTVMSRGPNNKSNAAHWWCLCDCGTYSLVRAADLKNGATKSCGCLRNESSVKRMRIMRPTQVGEKNPNWKGGITPEQIRVRMSTQYSEWRTQVFERDNYTCQKCGTRAGYINAHHIESFAGNPKLRTEISNGITFCKACHADFHHQYGFICNREQALEFLNREMK